MREIKFRAWDKKLKAMRYDAEMACNGCYQMNDINYFGQLINNPKYELMQYTGLKDKNGKEIYEGDIVKDRTMKYLGVIVWDEEDCSFSVRSTKTGMDYGIGVKKTNDLEVIGNKHENSELLEVTNVQNR